MLYICGFLLFALAKIRENSTNPIRHPNNLNRIQGNSITFDRDINLILAINWERRQRSITYVQEEVGH